MFILDCREAFSSDGNHLWCVVPLSLVTEDERAWLDENIEGYSISPMGNIIVHKEDDAMLILLRFR